MFKFNGISCEDKGMFVIEHFPIPVSIPRIKEQVIPGRDGVVTFSEGSYEGCEISGKVLITNKSKLNEIMQWLQGWGELTIEGAEDRYYIARLSNIVPITQFVENEVYEVPLTFKCQPFGYLLSGKQSIPISGGRVTNPSYLQAKPIIRTSASIDISINDTRFAVNNPSRGDVVIDCELQEVVDITNKVYLPYTGEFPTLEPGENTITHHTGQGNIQYMWRVL